MVWEPADGAESPDRPHKQSSLLLVSVKDSARYSARGLRMPRRPDRSAAGIAS